MTTLGKYADIAYNYNVISELMLCMQEEYRREAVRSKNALVIKKKKKKQSQSALSERRGGNKVGS